MKRFSIRDLLFLIVIVALALGWWLDKRPIPARFMIAAGGDHAYIIDTATGQAWEKSYSPNENTVQQRETPGFYTQKVSNK